MKIAFFIHDIYKTGGTERVTITLANTLSENNNEITIIESNCNFDFFILSPFYNLFLF